MSDYILGIKELDNEIEGIRKGSNIMLIGPPMSGKELILNFIMYHGATINENAVITVTTRESATHILEWFKENKMNLPMDRIGIIDCVSKTLGGTVKEDENIRIARSPVDLTGIGVKISYFLEIFITKRNIRKNQLHMNSLSTILMYSNIQTVFRFLHVFTGRIKSTGGLGIYLIESGMHDEQAITTLKQLFDGIIEIRSENDTNFIRVVGLSSKPTSWFEYEIEGAKLKIVGRK
jgi:KaiC/GvpD/RAD55 family RecA-like ATPase